MNSSRMNKLEELGRVDAEKAYTKKGKRNLKDEKKRVVKEIKGYAKGGMVTVSGTEYIIAQGGTNFAYTPTINNDGFDITFGILVTNVNWVAIG